MILTSLLSHDNWQFCSLSSKSSGYVAEWVNCLLCLRKSPSFESIKFALSCTYKEANLPNICNQMYKLEHRRCLTATPLIIYFLPQIAKQRKITYYIFHFGDVNLMFLLLWGGRKTKQRNRTNIKFPKSITPYAHSSFKLSRIFILSFTLTSDPIS